MKIKRLCSLLLCLVLVAALLPARVDAAGTISVSSVRFELYEDAYGARDDELVSVVVTVTAPETMRQLTVLLAASDIKTVTADNKNQVIYQGQIQTPADGTFSFPVEKSRIAAATGKTDPEGETLYLRVGGTGVSAVLTKVAYAEAEPNYGDLNGDKKVSSTDALMILRYVVGLASLTPAQLEAANVVQDGKVDISDAARILLYEAKLENDLVIAGTGN